MGLFDGLFGGSSNTSSGNGYASFIDDLVGGKNSAPQKEANAHDTGIFGFGSNDQYKPTGSTFMAYGKLHRSTDEALKHLDDTTCYSGTLICPVCQRPKSSPSALERCLQQHRLDGYNC